MKMKKMIEKVLLGFIGVMFLTNACFADSSQKISELANGEIKFEVTYTEPKDYVEVFIKQNDVQNIATDITNSVTANVDGTYSYQLIHPGYAAGDLVAARFYGHSNGIQEFTPAQFIPGFTTWGKSVIYSNPAGGSPYVTELANGKVLFKLSDTQQEYVEIFVRKNGTQVHAQNITSNYNSNQSVYQFADSGYKQGDELDVRFYSHATDGVRKFIPGSVENVWSKHKFGTYKNTSFVTSDNTYTIGAHVNAEGKPVQTEVFFDIGFDYLIPTTKTSQAANNWIIDRALAHSLTRDFLLDSVVFKGLYVRDCSGKWINANDTVYAPIQSPLRIGSQMFSLEHHYTNTLTNTLIDTNFACARIPETRQNVLVGGVVQSVLAVGRVHFAYVVEHQ
jgi:hypothetical protein